jgi:hypothetical protein
LTLNTDESFLEILNSSFTTRQKVYMLVDEEGISRIEGYIREIKKDLPVPLITIDDRKDISLDKIVAVNGVFRPEYGEC